MQIVLFYSEWSLHYFYPVTLAILREHFVESHGLFLNYLSDLILHCHLTRYPGKSNDVISHEKLELIKNFYAAFIFCPRSPIRETMSYSEVDTADDNQFVDPEMELFLPNLESCDLQHLQLKGDRLAWKSSLDSLKNFVMCDLQKQGKWTSPGGNMKQFKSTDKNLIINWYSKKQQTLCFQGRDGPTLNDRLVQLVQNMPEMRTDMLDSNTSTTAVQAESQTMSPSTLSKDFIRQTDRLTE